MRSEFLASLWKNFCGRGILNHTLVHCGTVLWVKISRFTSQPQKPQTFYHPKNTHYTVYAHTDRGGLLGIKLMCVVAHE